MKLGDPGSAPGFFTADQWRPVWCAMHMQDCEDGVFGPFYADAGYCLDRWTIHEYGDALDQQVQKHLTPT